MTIFSNAEKKATPEEMGQRISELEKKVSFLIIPALTSVLDEAMFNRTGALGNNPLRIWINLKLLEPGLPDEVKLYLTELFEKTDFSNYRPLRR